MRNLIAFALATSVAFAQEVDYEQAHKELVEALARPAGTRISDQNRERLEAFLARYEGRDLGPIGYAEALQAYLARDYDGAVRALEAFFADHDDIGDPEHATMAGRIYLNGFARAADVEAPDADALARYAARVARLYPDAGTLERGLVPRIFAIEDEAARRAVRLGCARGVLASRLTADEQDALLAALFTRAGAARAVDAAPIRPLPRTAPSEAAARAAELRESLTGQAAPVLRATHVLGFESEFSLAALRGKVVVLDFWATWCGPCRRIIPQLVELQDEHEAELQVVGVTRFYGYGTDFAEGPAKGVTRRGLEEAEEIAVNERFATAFEVDYPIVFVPAETSSAAYGIQGIPTVYVIGRDGRVVGHVVGASEDAHRQLVELIEGAL